MTVMSFFGLLLMFDPGVFFFDTAPVGVDMFLDELSMHDLGLAKTMRSRQHAVGLIEGEFGYGVGSEPGVVVGDRPEGYEEVGDPVHGELDRADRL